MAREITPIPTPFVETLLLGKNTIIGWVGSIAEDGTAIPEVNAYIYVYVNGFLVNTPVIDEHGNYINTNTKILSNKYGYWATDNISFDAYPGYKIGQEVYFKAKAKLKTLSAACVPYVVNGTQTPINLGIYSALNQPRAPYKDEIELYGGMSYWLYSVPTNPELYATEEKTFEDWYEKHHVNKDKFGTPIKDCNTELYIYSNNIYKGKIQQNTILGNDVAFSMDADPELEVPTTDFFTNNYLKFIVDNSELEIDLSGLSIYIDQETRKIKSSDLIEYLNNLSEFQDYCIAASLYTKSNDSPKQLKLSSYYTLDFYDIKPITLKPRTAPKISGVLNGNMTPGNHNVRISFVYYDGTESQPGPISNSIEISYSDSFGSSVYKALYLTNIEIGPLNVKARKIWLSKAGNLNNWYYATSIQDNISTTLLISNPDNTLNTILPFNETVSTNDIQLINTLFGNYTLFPGKNSNSEFYNYFNRNTGNWKYSSLDQDLLNSNIIKTVPWKTGEHLTARAYNNPPLVMDTFNN